jgi:mutator protein MutT
MAMPVEMGKVEVSAVVDVIAAVIERDGRYLVCRRPAGKRHAGLWEFPGGKVEESEGIEEAARRELREELDLELLEIGGELFSRNDPGTPFQIHFVPCRCKGEPRCIEHSDIAWLGPSELLACDLAPGDMEFARILHARIIEK